MDETRCSCLPHGESPALSSPGDACSRHTTGRRSASETGPHGFHPYRMIRLDILGPCVPMDVCELPTTIVEFIVMMYGTHVRRSGYFATLRIHPGRFRWMTMRHGQHGPVALLSATRNRGSCSVCQVHRLPSFRKVSLSLSISENASGALWVQEFV